MHFSNYFPYHPFEHTFVPIRAICVPLSTTASAFLSLYGLSDEFFPGQYLTKSPINFRTVLQPSNRYLYTFNFTLEIIETKYTTNEIKINMFYHRILFFSQIRI
jgi:hypothetical protein